MLEASWKFHNLLRPLNLYCIETLILDATILRDSILTRIENIRFQAYVHTSAIMWKVCFQELRALTNIKQLSYEGLNVNPMELNAIYEHVWNLGVLLKTDACLSILQEQYRPWPKVSFPHTPTPLPHNWPYCLNLVQVRLQEARSQEFYRVLERSRGADLAELREYETREDTANYEAGLREVLSLFGQAIHTSL